MGVLCGELSAPVLVLNLRGEDESAASRALRLHADAGEPCFLSVRQLLRTPPAFTPQRTGSSAYVCENPTVVAASADRLGPNSAPLICIEGQPCTASRVLLNRLRAAGIRLLYHGDFDWPGIQIANTIIARHDAAPWKMSAADCCRAVKGAMELLGAPVPASWDEQLMPAMCEAGCAVHEEQVLNDLLADLAESDAFK